MTIEETGPTMEEYEAAGGTVPTPQTQPQSAVEPTDLLCPPCPEKTCAAIIAAWEDYCGERETAKDGTLWHPAVCNRFRDAQEQTTINHYKHNER